MGIVMSKTVSLVIVTLAFGMVGMMYYASKSIELCVAQGHSHAWCAYQFKYPWLFRKEPR